MTSATIKLFIPRGDAKSLRTAEISNWTGVQDGDAVSFLTWKRRLRGGWDAREVGRLQHSTFTGKGVKAGTQHEEETRGGHSRCGGSYGRLQYPFQLCS